MFTNDLQNTSEYRLIYSISDEVFWLSSSIKSTVYAKYIKEIIIII